MNATQLDLLAPATASPKAPTMIQASTLYKWLDISGGTKKTTMNERVNAALDYYRSLFHDAPESVLMHPDDFVDYIPIDGLDVRPDGHVARLTVYCQRPEFTA